VDPSGQFWKCRAAAIGRSHRTVEAAFVEKYKESLSLDEAMLLAVEAIQRVVPKERTLFGIVVRNDKSTSPLTHDMLTRAGK
jgi:20S proteasome alpha/beta subunit